MTRYERTGWRDQEISARHREWGQNVPAVDLDFILIEYNRALPVAVVDYKRNSGQSINLDHPSYKAIAVLAGDLPFYIAFYDDKQWWFRIVPMNDAARRWFKDNQILTEYEYVVRMFQMRMMVAEQPILVKCNTRKPTQPMKIA